ncbi:MAG: transglutaminase-like domain-containing protein [Planctomycetota bacterium]|jgi:transglutaminase-like putative cysteine protease
MRVEHHFDFGSPAVRAWLDANGLRRGAGEGEVDLARRVFQVIAKGSSYEYLGRQERTASHVARAGKSDCGGLATLFVAALRSQGVPARVLAGRWAKSARPGERAGPACYFQEHVKAEFFASGVGWVPADLSSAVVHDKSPGKLRYFGNDDGDFLTFHVDTDLELDTLHFGRKTVTYLQKAAYWATGSGDFEGAVVDEDWRVGPLRRARGRQ